MGSETVVQVIKTDPIGNSGLFIIFVLIVLMPRFILIVLFAGLILSLSCKKENISSRGCLNAKLQEHNMVIYEGQELGCKYFLNLFEWEGKEYYLLGNHCADMAAIYTDCEGNQLCTSADPDPQTCDLFYKNRIDKGIVGIRKE